MTLLNPLLAVTGADWQAWTIPPGLKIGAFLGTVLDFLIIALALYLAIRAIAKFKRKEELAPPSPTEKECPYRFEKIPLAAIRCRACTSELALQTLIIFALLTLVLNSGVGGGAIEVGQVAAPLGYGLEAYFRTGNTINIALLTGTLATFHGMMFAAGRAIYALSRSGYSPRWFSVTGKGYTPYRALIIGSIVGFLCVVLTDIGSDTVDAVIVNLSVFGGLVSYILVMLSYVALKLTRPDLLRPYNSPLGLWGGIVGAALAVIALIACSLVPGYQLGLIGLVIALGAAIIWFLLVSRHH